MNLLTKIMKRCSRIFKIAGNINWLSFKSLYHRNAQILVWIPDRSLSYFGTDAFIWDMATISGLIKSRKNFRIVYGKNIGRYHNKKIFFTLSSRYNIYGFWDYTAALQQLTAQLELQGNEIFPKSEEALLWENKAYMHDVFKLANVREPKTFIYNSFEEVLNAGLSYPYLIKAEHSCASEGLYHIRSLQDLVELLSDVKFVRENKHIIVQELLNMRKDLRVIFVKDEIVLHYWRINLKDEWMPTSTSYGSKVDFKYFPEHWRQDITNTFRSLDITTGAFDITWQNDDLSTKPIYLEVSPFYQPNPEMDTKGKAYAYYKQHFNFFNSWDAKYVDLVFNIKYKQVQAYL
jgi:hypothetical protein